MLMLMRVSVLDIHLAAVIECPYFKDHRPHLSQIIVRRALEAAPSKVLEVLT
jgi:hypothetical protein